MIFTIAGSRASDVAPQLILSAATEHFEPMGMWQPLYAERFCANLCSLLSVNEEEERPAECGHSDEDNSSYGSMM